MQASNFLNVKHARLKTNHRFLDEAGDTTFYTKERLPAIGTPGVSLCFILGMVKFRVPLDEVRHRIKNLQIDISTDPYFNNIQSITRKKENGGFYFHATDDIPEVRKVFFDFIKGLNCSCEAVSVEKFQGYMNASTMEMKVNSMRICSPIC